MPRFGQIVIGPPGCGKTTYCFAIKEYYQYFGRKSIIINLDPANEVSKNFDIDIRELIKLDDVIDEFSLGPNSSFLYCFSFLEKNFDWLLNQINKKENENAYLIFDNPGQIEIFTQFPAFKNIIKKLTSKELDFRLCTVNLIESNNLSDMSKYVFSILSVLNAMINMELPQINIISKIDLLKELDADIPFPLSFYKNPSEYDKLHEFFDEANMNPKFKTLNKLISEFVIDYSLVSFDVLDVNNQRHLNKIATLIDKANGYIFMNTGKLDDEKYVEMRNTIAKNDLDYENDEDEDEEYLK